MLIVIAIKQPCIIVDMILATLAKQLKQLLRKTPNRRVNFTAKILSLISLSTNQTVVLVRILCVIYGHAVHHFSWVTVTVLALLLLNRWMAVLDAAKFKLHCD